MVEARWILVSGVAMTLEPITISLIEYRVLIVFLIVVPSILLVATIQLSIWLAKAFLQVWLAKAVVRLRVRK